MDFSGLVKGVQDFWDFIWPPIFCLIALVGIAAYVAPQLLNRLWTKLIGLRPTDQRQIQFIKVSKRFGFDKLLPIICAFFLVFMLDIVRNIVAMGGQAIPPVITYSSTTLLLDDSHDVMVQCLWKTREESIHQQRRAATKGPSPQTANAEPPSPGEEERELENRYGTVGIYEVQEIIDAAAADARVQHKDSPPVLSLHHYEEEAGAAYMVFNALKFLFLYTIVIGFLELRHSAVRGRIALRTVLVLMILSLGVFGYFLRFLKMSQEVEGMRRYVAQVYPLKDSLNCKGFDEQTAMDLDRLYEDTISHERSHRQRWWSLEFPDTKIFVWGWNQLKPPPPE
jgi:hypothetical protein